MKLHDIRRAMSRFRGPKNEFGTFLIRYLIFFILNKFSDNSKHLFD